MVDTAASLCVLEGVLADLLSPYCQVLSRDQQLSSRMGTFVGDLVRAPITLLADEGESLTVDATVFLSTDWPGPNFIGYNGLLERIRFAVDPPTNSFYFGV